METKPNFRYNANELLPYDETCLKVRAWANRLKAKTGKNVFYAVTAFRVEVWHDGIDTASHNRAVESLARVLFKVLSAWHTR
tara:strand:+ start:1164 stop:1409 length:246 start_codon:yes stop_codon:yes gene_type:complete